MNDKQARAREFIDADLRDAIGLIDDVVKLLPNAGLPASPKLDDRLSRARAELTAARDAASALMGMANQEPS